jgi:ribosomal protein L37AE/L43A
MGAEENRMNKNLSRMVADLFVKSKGGEDLSSKIRRLRDEINKEIENEDALTGKYRGLLESFREIIPDEKQRYHAAIKALSTTSKLSQQEIAKAVNTQLQELKVLEKGLMPAIPVWREDLKVMEAKSKGIKDEISKLRDKIERLESEEEGIRKGMAAREKELELIEKEMKGLFTDIGTEIALIKDKIEEFAVKSAPVQPIVQKASTPSPKSDIPIEKKVVDEQKTEIQAPSEPRHTEFQKTCPMCGGRMNFHANEKLWMCYTCAYEELETGEGPGKREEKSDYMNEPASDPLSEPSPSFVVPLADLSPNEYQVSKKDSSPAKSQPPTKTKPCPSCRKKMYWYPEENAWRCPSCHYETRILK